MKGIQEDDFFHHSTKRDFPSVELDNRWIVDFHCLLLKFEKSIFFLLLHLDFSFIKKRYPRNIFLMTKISTKVL
jgi:hypothetical protein